MLTRCNRFNILWVDATDTLTIQQGFKYMAANIFGPRERKTPVQDVIRWLEQSDEDWLLVFDNAPVSGLAKYLPDRDNGNILYTSRHRNLQPRLRPECVADVEEMEIQDAVILLLRSAQQSDYDDDTRGYAKDIVRALGFLPLAIDQAGAYIHMAPCSLDQFLGVFNEQKEVLLRSPRFKGGDALRHIAVYATFNISHKVIMAFADKKEDMDMVKDAVVALKLLNLICFYNNEGTIRTIFIYAARFRYEMERYVEFPLEACGIKLDDLVWTSEKHISPEAPGGRMWDFEDYVRGMSFLNEFSLLKVNFSTGYSNMHILVHDWARNRMSDRERMEWGFAARSILMDSLDLKSNLKSIAHRRDILPHLEVCRKHVKLEHIDDLLESEYQGKMARVFRQVRNLEAAEDALTTALEKRKGVLGLLNNGTFAAMSQLGVLYEDQGRFSKSEEMLREVLDRRRLLQIDMKWDALDKAQRVAGKGNEGYVPITFEADDPLDDPQILNDTKSLIHVLTRQDQRKAAADLCLKIQKWYERADLDGPMVNIYKDFVTQLTSTDPMSLSSATTVLEAQQLVANAEARFGPRSQIVMSHKATLASALQQEGGCLAAEELYREVYEWKKESYGEDSIEAAEAWRRVGKALQRQNRAFEADVIFYAVVAKFNEVFGPTHPKTLSAKVDLGICLYAKTEYDEAIRIMQECAEARRVVLGPQHTLMLQSEHCVRQFRHTQAIAPEHLLASFRNKAIQDSIDVLGDCAPEWMRQWEPEPEEELILAAYKRGTLRRMGFEVIDQNGFPFMNFLLLDYVRQPQTLEMTLVEGGDGIASTSNTLISQTT